MRDTLGMIVSELPNARRPVGDKESSALGIQISPCWLRGRGKGGRRGARGEEKREERVTCAASNDSSTIEAVHARLVTARTHAFAYA